VVTNLRQLNVSLRKNTFVKLREIRLNFVM